MIKVLHVLSTTSASYGDMVVVMNYYRNIDREKVSFDFATMIEHPDKLDDEIKSMGGNIFHFDKPRLKTMDKSLKQLTKIITQGDYDIVHLHVPILQIWVKKAMQNAKCKKLIIHSHSTKLSTSTFGKIRNRLMVMGINSKVSARFACSYPAAKALYGKAWGKRNFDCLINNAIDINKFKYDSKLSKQMREKLNIEKDTLAICHVGRFHKEKNHEKLIGIFAEMKKKNEKCHLYLIGEGPLKQNIQDLVVDHGLQDDVTFMGNRNDVFEVLKAMDIYILPSLFEGLSVSLIEAQASGLLCFCSNACAKDSMVTNNLDRIGLLESDEYWAQHILDKYKEGWNRDTSQMIIEHNYDIKTEGQKLLKKYEEILNG